MKRVTYVIALVVVLAGSAMAQRSVTSSIGPNSGIDPVVQIMFGANGIETTKGVYDELNEKCWGNTFAIKGGNQRETYLFTVSMDYLGQPGTGNKLAGGTWTLSVYKHEVYVGMLYGEITGGTIRWELDAKGNPVARYSDGTINVLGGTDYYDFVTDGTVSGVFSFFSEAGVQKPHVKAMVQIGF